MENQECISQIINSVKMQAIERSRIYGNDKMRGNPIMQTGAQRCIHNDDHSICVLCLLDILIQRRACRNHDGFQSRKALMEISYVISMIHMNCVQYDIELGSA